MTGKIAIHARVDGQIGITNARLYTDQTPSGEGLDPLWLNHPAVMFLSRLSRLDAVINKDQP